MTERTPDDVIAPMTPVATRERKKTSAATTPARTGDRADDELVVNRLEEAARLLELQGANPFRVRAYRRAANTVASLELPLREVIARGGYQALEELPDVGSGIASAIRELLTTGRWSQLERLRGSLDAVALFTSLPGLGRDLAERIHGTLGVDTLEGLEAAAYDGRLSRVPGIGPRRTAAIRAGLATALGRQRSSARPRVVQRPSAELLLDVDAQYRTRALRGELRRIAPKRFNPRGEAWLPIMHLEQEGWHFTALYSNTALAHELGRTDDWVVIYYYDGDHRESQCTVVTETLGPIRGLRVVRGRERECAAMYRRRRERAGMDSARQETGPERARRPGEPPHERE
jgi:putative hydrolase